jgi:PhnB protein
MARKLRKAKAKPKAKTKSKMKKKMGKKRSVKKATRANKKKKISAIPRGYSAITPYLVVADADSAIEFYKKAFGAKNVKAIHRKDGKIMHAEFIIGDSRIMLAEECAEKNMHGPRDTDMGVTMHMYVKNVDSIFDRAVEAGATVLRPVENMFYGDRAGGLADPFNHKWYISSHVEDVSKSELKKRMARMNDQQQ